MLVEIHDNLTDWFGTIITRDDIINYTLRVFKEIIADTQDANLAVRLTTDALEEFIWIHTDTHVAYNWFLSIVKETLGDCPF